MSGARPANRFDRHPRAVACEDVGVPAVSSVDGSTQRNVRGG